MRNLKKFLALVLAMMMVMGLMVTVNAADTIKTDAPITDEYQAAVNVLFKLGVLKGGTGGVYHPQDTISRAEFAMMLFRINTGITQDSKTAAYAQYANFKDVPSNYWAAGAIGYVQENGLMKGIGGNQFNPAGDIDGYSVLVSLLRVLGYDVYGELTGSQWSVNALIRATDIGMTAHLITTAGLSQPATRETVAELIYTTLTELSLVAYNAEGGRYEGQIGNGSNVPLGELKFDMDVINIGEDASWASTMAKYGLDDDYSGRPQPTRVLVVKGEPIFIERPEPAITFEGQYKAGDAMKQLKAMGITEAQASPLTAAVSPTGKPIPAVVVYENGKNGNDEENVLRNGVSTVHTGHYNNTTKYPSLTNETTRLTAVLDLLTSVDNNIVEVYVNDNNKVGRIVVSNICADVLSKGDVVAAKGDDAAYIKLGDMMGGTWNWEITDGEYAAGDVVVYTLGWNGTDRVIVSAEHAASFEGDLDKITTKTVNGYSGTTVLTIDGTEYVVSGYPAAAIELDGDDVDADEDYTWYLSPNGTIVAVDKGEEEAAAPTPTNYVYVLNHGVPANTSTDPVTGNKTWTAPFFGVKADGTYGSWTATWTQAATPSWTNSDGKSANGTGLYTYVMSGSNYKLTAVKAGSTDLNDIKVTANIASGDAKVTYGSSKTAALNDNTAFVFIQYKGDPSTAGDYTLATGYPFVQTGSKELGKEIKTTTGGSINAYVGVKGGVSPYAEVVFVFDTYAAAASDATETLVWVDAATKVVSTTGADTTEYTYTVYGADGEPIEGVVCEANITTSDVYALNEDGTLSKTAYGSRGNGIITSVKDGSLVIGNSTYLNITSKTTDAYLTGVQTSGFTNDVTDSVLKIGQTVYYATKGGSSTDVVAIWVLKDQPVKSVTPVEELEVQASSVDYIVSIVPVADEFIGSKDNTAGGIVKNVFQVIVTRKDEGAFTGASVTVNFDLVDGTDSPVSMSTTITGLTSGTSKVASKQIWLSSVNDLVINNVTVSVSG